MIDEKRKEEIRDFLGPTSTDGQVCIGCKQRVHPGLLRGRGFCLDCRIVNADELWENCYDLLSACDELVADNAALAKAAHAVSDLIDNSHGVHGLHLNGDLAPWDELLKGGRFEDWLHELSDVLLGEHPGAALLARHAEELKAKDGEIARRTAERDSLANEAIALQSSLNRAREALRNEALGSISQDHTGCATCGGYWEHDEDEIHLPITLNGHPWPCPAAPEGEQG